MAKIKKLPSGSWHTVVYMGKDSTGKDILKSVTAPTKDQVVVKVGELKKKKVENKTSTSTVRDAVRKYIDINKPLLSPTTAARYERMLQHGFPHFMDTKLINLSQEVCQIAINAESKRPKDKGNGIISAKTVHNEWGLISSALKAQGYSFFVKLPKIQKEVEELPHPQQVMDAILGTRIELPCLLAMWCGLRMSEIRGLSKESIHGNELFIDKVVVDVDGMPILKHFTKTDSSMRRVQIPPYIMSLIKNTDGYKYPSQNGDFVPLIPCTHRMIYSPFRRIMDKAGLDITFHDLRHIFALVKLQILGQSIRTVQNAGGWKNEEVLMRIYSQGFSEERQKADAETNAFYSSLLETCTRT